jgi:superfamily II DNA helicase RecQ
MVELAFEGKQNFVGVLPTGGGKSLVFLLPAFAATADTPSHELVQKTLVIIPNRSLLQDTMRKAMLYGVSCNQWSVDTSDRVIKDTALLLIAIESFASYKFRWRVFLNLLNILFDLMS